VILFDYLAANGQAQSGALAGGFGGEKGLKDSLGLAVGQAHTDVGQADSNVVSA
jgi:hypothetical protein